MFVNSFFFVCRLYCAACGGAPHQSKSISVGAGHDPPADFAKQDLFAVRRKNDDFPSGNPKIVPIFGGRVMTLPYSNDFQPGRNPKVFDIALAVTAAYARACFARSLHDGFPLQYPPPGGIMIPFGEAGATPARVRRRMAHLTEHPHPGAASREQVIGAS